MSGPIDVVEQAIVDEFAGRCTRADAIARICSVLNVTEHGAADLMNHPVAPRLRYQRLTDEVTSLPHPTDGRTELGSDE